MKKSHKTNTMKVKRLLKGTEWGKVVSLLLLSIIVTPSYGQGGDITSDTQALARFKSAVDRKNHLDTWNGPNACNGWKGVTCDNSNSRVQQVRVPGKGLVGPIPINTLGQLDQIRVFSLRSNRLGGELPSDFSNLALVQNFYLNDNQFSGPLPSNFALWPRLVHVNLANNNFSGPIPASLANLTQATSISLQNNKLTGSIPDFANPNLTDFNVANNQLSGPIPTSLARFPASSFANNIGVCGVPTPVVCPAPPPAPLPPLSPSPPPLAAGPGPKAKKSRLGTGAIIAIVVGDVILVLLLLVACFLCYRKRKERRVSKSMKGELGIGKGDDSKDGYSSSIQEPERNKLVFFEGKRYTFDLEDLLRASAEVLGKGSVGTAYKAVLEDGSIVAVKRLKDVTTAKKDFETQIQSIGKLDHRNLVPLRAYYFSKDEKLLVYDYMPSGSLSALLHGTKGGSRTPLDWITRIRVATGAGRGLAFLHNQNFTHGNIKSSNVLLTRDLEGCMSDFGLAQLLSTSAAASRIVGYRAPEVLETRKVTAKADVYSFGVLLLELLTGKAPTQATLNDEGIDLPRWVQSVVREEWTAEVFDLELMRFQNIEEEMVQMLQIAMQCVSQMPEQRPPMDEIVKLLEDIRQFSDSGNENGDDTSRSAYDTSRSAYDTSAEKSKDDFDNPSFVENPSDVYSFSESFAAPATRPPGPPGDQS